MNRFLKLFKNETIDIIIPVYNSAKFLRKCIDSVLTQSYKDFKIILINDGSTDNSKYICDEYVKKDKRVFLVNQEHRGLSLARNVGLTYAKDKYLLFLDSDDSLFPNALTALYDAMKKDDVDIVFSSFKAVDINGTLLWDMKVKEAIYQGEDKYTFIYEKNNWLINIWGKLFKRSIFKGIGFKPNYNYEDAFIYSTYVERAEKIKVIPFETVNFLVRDDGIVYGEYTYRNLEELEAHLYLLEFYRKHNYQKAFELEKRKALHFFYPYHYLKIKENLNHDKEINDKFSNLCAELKNYLNNEEINNFPKYLKSGTRDKFFGE